MNGFVLFLCFYGNYMNNLEKTVDIYLMFGLYLILTCFSSDLHVLADLYFVIARRLFRLVENRETSKWQSKEVNMCGPDLCTPPLNGTYLPHILSFGEDEDGKLGLGFDGQVFRRLRKC